MSLLGRLKLRWVIILKRGCKKYDGTVG
jgi:hypothetical protein